MSRIENLIEFGNWKILVEGISRSSEAVDASSESLSVLIEEPELLKTV